MSSTTRISSRLLRVLACLAVLAVQALCAQQQEARREIRISMVGSKSTTEASLWAEQLRKEILSLAGSRFTPQFIEEPDSTAAWTSERAAASLDAALANTQSEVVLAIDPLSIRLAASPERRLAKPVIGGLHADPELSPLPFGADGRTAKTGFLVHASLYRTADLVMMLRRVIPFTALRILFDPDAAGAPETWKAGLERHLGIPVTLLPISDRPEECLARLGEGTSPVLLMPSLRYTREQRTALFKLLAERRIPSFSFEGERDVMEGALAGGLPEDCERLARSVALRLDRIVAGNDHIDLPSVLSLQPGLIINQRVAGETGVALDFRAHSSATFVDRIDGNTGPVLSLHQAVLGALDRSNALKARQAASEGARESQRMAKDALGPRLAATFRHQQVDRDRAEFAGVVLPETVVRGGLVFEQTLVDSEAWARARAAREAYLASTHQEKAARLEIIERASIAYLQHLSALALVRIAEENLASTGHNMDLARLRQRTGSAGPEEILRFQSAEAQHRADLARARAQLAQARIALGRVCNMDPSAPWSTEELGLDHSGFAFSSRKVIGRLSSEDDIRRFVAWSSAYALKHSPDLAVLEQLSRAQRIDVDHKARRSMIPKVSVGATYDRVLDMELGGPPLIEQLARRGILPPPSRLPDNNEWGVALTASLPLFTSGALSAELRKSRAELRQIEYSRADAREAVAARACAAFYAMEGTYPSIELAAVSAESARRNLEIGQQKYEQGTVSIIALLDAQTTAFSARQASELAVYRFLSDLVSFQRAIGWYEVLSSPEDMSALFAEIESALQQR